MDSLGRLLDDLARQLRGWGVLQGSESDLSDRFREGLRQRNLQLAQNLLMGLLNSASSTISVLIQLFGILFIAVYLLADVRTVRNAILGLPPDRYRSDTRAWWNAFSATFSRYLSGVLFVAAFQGDYPPWRSHCSAYPISCPLVAGSP